MSYSNIIICLLAFFAFAWVIAIIQLMLDENFHQRRMKTDWEAAKIQIEMTISAISIEQTIGKLRAQRLTPLRQLLEVQQILTEKDYETVLSKEEDILVLTSSKLINGHEYKMTHRFPKETQA